MKVTFLTVNISNWDFNYPATLLRSYLSTTETYKTLEFSDLCYRIDRRDNQIVNFDIDDIVHDIEEIQPDVLAVSTYIWNIGWMYELLPRVKETFPNINIVAGGPEYQWDSLDNYQQYNFLDYIVIGAGEVPFYKLLTHLKSPTEHPFSDVPNIMFRDKNNVLVPQKGKEYISALNNYPSPYENNFINRAKLNGGSAPLFTQRGCPLACAFCFENKLADKVDYLRTKTVFEDIDRIFQLKAKGIFFMDSTFNSNPKRAKQILKYIVSKTKTTGHALDSISLELVPEFLDKEMIMLLKIAGANFLELGVQSTNPQAMSIMQRYRNEKKLFENIKFCTRLKLGVMLTLIYGLPKDSVSGFLKSFDDLYFLTTEKLEIFRLALLPGTEYRSEAKKYGIVFDNQIKKGEIPYQLIMSSDFSKEDLQHLENFATVVKLLNKFKHLIVPMLKNNKLLPSEFFCQILDSFSPYAGTRGTQKEWYERIIHFLLDMSKVSASPEDIEDLAKAIKEKNTKVGILIA